MLHLTSVGLLIFQFALRLSLLALEDLFLGQMDIRSTSRLSDLSRISDRTFVLYRDRKGLSTGILLKTRVDFMFFFGKRLHKGRGLGRIELLQENLYLVYRNHPSPNDWEEVRSIHGKQI